ncbi:MAG: hypothetical protein LPK45_08850 [Bacteroidota bacterium]|nr:hypothetical protein [Bacteroidota bacterium]MDX5431192.1 hypothetical protein [Bacteroidota bacterium]MDX5469931.1 hypothetical protein [Bacteroidota bacterium]
MATPIIKKISLESEFGGTYCFRISAIPVAPNPGDPETSSLTYNPLTKEMDLTLISNDPSEISFSLGGIQIDQWPSDELIQVRLYDTTNANFKRKGGIVVNASLHPLGGSGYDNEPETSDCHLNKLEVISGAGQAIINLDMYFGQNHFIWDPIHPSQVVTINNAAALQARVVSGGSNDLSGSFTVSNNDLVNPLGIVLADSDYANMSNIMIGKIGLIQLS